MIIEKLEVKGLNKKTASLRFEQGLNVIAGASDTGKSYITKCFQFIFGAEHAPKKIAQAEGYTSLEVTFKNNDSKRFLLSRELKDGADITCTELDNDNLKTILKPTHKGVNNLSLFFLRTIGLDDQILVKGKESLNHSALTLRIFERLFLVDEERIISEDSPLGTGQHTERTLELSLLKTLLTGKDDSEVRNLKQRKNSKDSIKQKINNLEEFLERFFPDFDEKSETLDELEKSLEELEGFQSRTEDGLNAVIESNNVLIGQRSEFIRNLDGVHQAIVDDSVLLDRFSLLAEKYASDKERLEANSEAVTYIEQQRLVNCPTCGSEIAEDNDEIDMDLIVVSNRAEIGKINSQLFDLQSTIEQITQANDQNKGVALELEEKIRDIDQTLSVEIGDKLKSHKEIMSEVNVKTSQFKDKREKELKRKTILEEIGLLQKEYDDIIEKYEIPDFSKECKSFVKQVSDILVRWDFPNASDTEFDLGSRDITLGSKPRGHFGKGFRAICFSAFVVGLMEHLVREGRHPGFVILDSPLTTYKKQDEDGSSREESDEAHLANNMIYAFYRDLCDCYKDKQIIVLDNQEPYPDLKDLMNYVHFSHNEKIGRYGFFPFTSPSQEN